MTKNLYIVGIIICVVVLGGSFWAYNMFDTYAPKEYMVETETKPSTETSPRANTPVTTTTETTPTKPTPSTTTATTVNTTTGEVTPGAKTYTMADVSAHKSMTSCYSAINGVVYDLTMWINMHPGGKDKILAICGIDGTNNFMMKHHGAEKFMTVLARFKIGMLTQ